MPRPPRSTHTPHHDGDRRSSRDRRPASAAAAAAAAVDTGPQRIAKLLARAGVASRRDIERMIAEGRIAIDGKILTTPATLLSHLNGVTVDGQAVEMPTAARLFRFHKPPGCLTAANDHKGRKTIYDMMPPGLPRLLPVGRLDFNTEGLLLLTTDGELKRALELPANRVSRRYRVRVFGTVEQRALESLAEGITVEGVRYGSIIADVERKLGRNSWLAMTLTEGKNREVRRVLEAIGLQVTRLLRIAYGPYELEDLAPGAVAEVHGSDIARLRKGLNLP